MLHIILDYLKIGIISFVSTIVAIIFIMILYIWPASWFTNMIIAIIIAFVLFLFVGIIFCYGYSLYQKRRRN